MSEGIESYSVNPANNQMTTRGNINYTYDAAGNLASDGTRTFLWDALGRLKQVQEGEQVIATYGYDIQNRRFRKTVGSTTTYYLYNLDNQLIAEISGTGTVLREYVWLDREPFLLAEYTGTSAGMYFYVNDHLGTPYRLINGDTGAVAWHAAYLPFGEAQIMMDAVTNNLRFPGQYYDVETGLHYNWNRYYDPEKGRYISTDLVGLEGGLNLYTYTGNNTINFIDLYGKYLKQALVVGGSIAIIDGPLPIADIAAVVALVGLGIYDTYNIWTYLNESNSDEQCNEKKSEDKKKTGDITVGEVLKHKKGSIKNAPLEKGSPTLDEIRDVRMSEVRKRAQQGVPGYRTLHKLLTDRRFDK